MGSPRRPRTPRGAQHAFAEADQLTTIDPYAGEVPDGLDPTTNHIAREAEHGVVEVKPDGTFVYMPMPGFVGLDSFAFKVCEWEGECHRATMVVDVLPDDR
ncbi:MAG: Ig-like domain-containing protein [Acidobacteriota bacterium]